MSNNDGGFAFPNKATQYADLNAGMTLRDYFAAKAMQGMCADPNTTGRKGSDIAEEAYQMADAMLAARNN